MNPKPIDVAQDYMDCVSGDHGPRWKDRANQFMEDYLDELLKDQDAATGQFWALWELVRTTEVIQ